jgi:hypothetical protein
MKRGKATRGRVAKLVAGATSVEVKATVPSHQVREALRRANLVLRADERRYVYFFDTPRLDLLRAGIIGPAASPAATTTAR